ncbi:uncharacterized protein LOC116287595 [Actinia tenebrosa]|uniref:Uncharacterized protein LOC116287595 n=1 Tax=Actinia tenebrosa TaxID=6105 RepID=A0A6P8H160_ACTTE|nr:uncharacterized protein LOC116287595 [Actinia tenebrosa]XP_031550144.1 uncharacterized protein LOC116287595 [Actinia tenebrosa]
MATEPPTPKPSSNGPDVMTTTNTSGNSTAGILPLPTEKPTIKIKDTSHNQKQTVKIIVAVVVPVVILLVIIAVVKYCKKKKAQNVIANEEFPLQRRSSEKFVQQNASGIDNDPEDPVIRGQDNLDDEAVEEYVDSEFGEIRMELE